MKTNPPCYDEETGTDCSERHVGCHAECKAYQDWQAIHETERAKQWKFFSGLNEVDARRKEKLTSMGKRLRTKRRVGQP